MRRAAGCQRSSDYERLDLNAAILTERKTVAKGNSAPAVEAAIFIDNPASKNNIDGSETLKKKRLDPQRP